MLRNRARFLASAWMVLGCCLSWMVLIRTVTAAHRPNVLFIAVDDLRPEMTCYGVSNMVTPNFDRLASRGVRFDRAYCNIAVCGASRASLMSGLRPTPDRFTSYLTRVDEDVPDVTTIPKAFRDAGYHTVTNGKIYHHRGDDAEAWSEPDFRPRVGGLFYAKGENRAMNAGQNSRGPAYEAATAADDRYPDHMIADKTISDLERLSKEDQPFFLACGFLKPHLPFVTPQRTWDLYPAHEVQLPENMFFTRDLPQAFNYQWAEMRAYHGIPEEGPVTNQTARDLIRGYRACVSFIDDQIGRLLDELDRLGLAENTIIVLWGDHGWQLGEHGFWCKHTNFEVATRVPLLIAAPGIEPGRASQRLVEYVDIYPTLCDLADVPKPNHLQGKSLLPLLKDVDAEHKDEVFTRFGAGDAIRTDRYRYMELRAMQGKGNVRAIGLFDLDKDPEENQNVAEHPDYADVLDDLRSRLDKHRAGFVEQGS